MKKVAILYDASNDWISKFFPKDLNDISGYTFEFFYDPTKIKNYEIVFVLGYTRILGPSFLSNNKLAMVVHESNLPEGKGFAPLQWQILEGKNDITFSLIEINHQVDSGDIILQSVLNLNGTELYDELRYKQSKITFDLVKEFLNIYPSFKKTKQQGKETFYKKRSIKHSELNMDKTLRELFPLLRINNNNEWPSFFKYKGNKYILKIFKSQQDEENTSR